MVIKTRDKFDVRQFILSLSSAIVGYELDGSIPLPLGNELAMSASDMALESLVFHTRFNPELLIANLVGNKLGTMAGDWVGQKIPTFKDEPTSTQEVTRGRPRTQTQPQRTEVGESYVSPLPAVSIFSRKGVMNPSAQAEQDFEPTIILGRTLSKAL